MADLHQLFQQGQSPWIDNLKRDYLTGGQLRRLVEEGILERVRYRERPDRHEYLLTERGRELAPVVQALRGWGRRWTTGVDLSPTTVHAACGHEITLEYHCPHCERLLGPEEVRLRAR